MEQLFYVTFVATISIPEAGAVINAFGSKFVVMDNHIIANKADFLKMQKDVDDHVLQSQADVPGSNVLRVTILDWKYMGVPETSTKSKINW